MRLLVDGGQCAKIIYLNTKRYAQGHIKYDGDADVYYEDHACFEKF